MSTLPQTLSPVPLRANSHSPPSQLQQAQQTPIIKKPTSQPPTPKPNSESRSQVSWIQELRSHTRSNRFAEAVSVYIDMTVAGIQPNNFAFPAVLKAVTGLHEFSAGKQLHGAAVKLGEAESSVAVFNTLLNMYAKCGAFEDVCKLFDRIPERDQVSWNSMIAALCRFEEWELGLEFFRVMQSEGVEPSSFTLVSVANACCNLGRRDGVRLGKQVHGYSLKVGEVKTFTHNALMNMYSRLGRVDDARAVFELFGERDMVSWNTMISSLSQSERFYEALMFLRLMVLEGLKPDGVTIASVLPACSNLELLDIGREIHAYALRTSDLIENSFVGSALVDMYCNCRKADRGRAVFDGILSRKLPLWNAMLAGYTQNGFYEKALKLFLEMTGSGLIPNPTSMASVLPASVHCKEFRDKEGMHGYVAKLGFGGNRYVQNALMDVYSRMGKIDVSRNIFDSMETRDIVSWNTIITGYVVCGYHEDALMLLHEMQRVDEKNDNRCIERILYKPNSITLMSVLPGCAALSALAKGKEIHAYAVKSALALDLTVGSALVDMYAKCGCLNLARRVFDAMPMRNVITWNALIMAYGMHGKGDEALKLFRSMVAAEGARVEQVQPNEVTFIAIFAACSHSGLVKEGRILFHDMKHQYGIEPTEDHYACAVDLLGRAGQLDEAYQLISDMPPEFDKVGAWSSLLGACRIHQNVELGEIAANNLLHLEPHVASHYVLLSNIYSSAGLWEKATEVRKNMIKKGVKKEPGCSWIEFDDEVHKFVAGDVSHPQSEQLHGFLENLSEKLKKEGYKPDTSCVLHNVDEEEKENLLCGHSERLAIAFGILNTPPGTTIRVSKNLRVCNDCHTATKFISKVVEREIIVRDVRRFHHIKNGICSCGDYW